MGLRLIVKNKDPEAAQKETEIRDYDQDVISLGRHSVNDLQVAHPGASRQHCKIVRENGNYFLIDPGSANGTMLNGRKIPMKNNQLLKDNDLISIESYEIRFKTMDRVSVKGPGERTDEVALRVVREVLGSLQAKTNPSLEVTAGTSKGKVIEIYKDVQQIVIGRSETCDLVLNEPLVSRRNTKIRRDWSGIMIFDMNSKNGTYVNGKKINEQILRDGDRITIGEATLLFRNPKEGFSKDLAQDAEEHADEIQAAPALVERPNEIQLQGREKSGASSSRAPGGTGSAAKSPTRDRMERPAPLAREQLEGTNFGPLSILSTFTTKDYVMFGTFAFIFIVCFIFLVYWFLSN